MRPHLVFLSLAFLALSLSASQPIASAQTQPTAEFPAELQKNLAALRDAALADDYTYKQVAHLTENIGPRPVGSAQAQGAVDYVAAELRKLGLEVRLEEVQVPHWVRGVETAELVEYPGQAPGTVQKVVLTALGGNTPTSPQGLTAEIVVAHSFDELKALGREKVAGKIVLFEVRFDQQKADAGFAMEAYGEAVAYRGGGAKAAAQLGAVGMLVRSVGGADYRLPHTGGSAQAGIPAGAVTVEDADMITHLAAQGKVRIHITLTSGREKPVTSYNVVADLKGWEHPEEIVVVSGHLDSWDLGTGAIDDAAGVAVAMETAKLVQELKLHPRRTIRVIAWMDEENDGNGQTAYTAAHGAEFSKHVGAIESDSGAAHPLGFYAKVNEAALPLLRPVQEVLRPIGANVMRFTAESPEADIGPMAKAGVPAFGLIQAARTYFFYHHTAADTLDKIVPKELQENAAAMAVMGYALADMTHPLPR